MEADLLRTVQWSNSNEEMVTSNLNAIMLSFIKETTWITSLKENLLWVLQRSINIKLWSFASFYLLVIKASEPVVSVVLGLLINSVVPKPLTALSLLPITYGVAYASTLGQLDVVTMSRELGTMAAKWVFYFPMESLL